MEKQKIITLIREDLKHNQLLNGLGSIGLWDNEQYLLSLDLLIAELMGHGKGKIPDEWFNCYQQVMLSVPNNLPSKELEMLANSLYETLSNLRK